MCGGIVEGSFVMLLLIWRGACEGSTESACMKDEVGKRSEVGEESSGGVKVECEVS